MQRINFYRQRVAINVLAKDIANAREIHEAAEGHAVIGVLGAIYQRRTRRCRSAPLDGGSAFYFRRSRRRRSGAVLQSGNDRRAGPPRSR